MYNKKYLQFIREKPCIICHQPAEPHHVNALGYIPQRFRGGVGMKSTDFSCIPLCRKHHMKIEESIQDFEDLHTVDIRLEIMYNLMEYLVLNRGEYAYK